MQKTFRPIGRLYNAHHDVHRFRRRHKAAKLPKNTRLCLQLEWNSEIVTDSVTVHGYSLLVTDCCCRKCCRQGNGLNGNFGKHKSLNIHTRSFCNTHVIRDWYARILYNMLYTLVSLSLLAVLTLFGCHWSGALHPLIHYPLQVTSAAHTGSSCSVTDSACHSRNPALPVEGLLHQVSITSLSISVCITMLIAVYLLSICRSCLFGSYELYA